jgi:hypothetical protein
VGSFITVTAGESVELADPAEAEHKYQPMTVFFHVVHNFLFVDVAKSKLHAIMLIVDSADNDGL